jgi:hypothetical protein
MSDRHAGVQDKIRWLTPNPNLPAGPAVTVAEGCHRLAVSLLTVIEADSPQLTIGLQHLIEAKDAFVRAAIGQQERHDG